MITLHAVSSDDIHQLARGACGETQLWEGFYRRYITKSALLRTGRLTTLGDLPSKEMMNLSSEVIAEKLNDLYEQTDTLGIKAREALRFGRRKLGLDEAVKSLWSINNKRRWDEFEAEFGFIAAQLGNATLPAWEASQVNLSFLWRLGWEPLRQKASHPGEELVIQPPFNAHPIEAPYSAGIYIKPEDISEIGSIFTSELPELLKTVERKQIPSQELLPGLERMKQAIAFAKLRKCGLIEACDIVQ